MALKLPPPPQFAGPQWQQFNRWMIELQSILSNQGGIDPSEVSGLSDVIAQVDTNTTNITALQGTSGGQGSAITALQFEVTNINVEIAAINSEITTLSARAQSLNGSGVPAVGVGNVNDWYADTTGHHVYVKTAVGTWTLIV